MIKKNHLNRDWLPIDFKGKTLWLELGFNGQVGHDTCLTAAPGE